MKKNIPIGRILLNDGSITEGQLQRALEFQKKNPSKRLGRIFVELNYTTERTMLQGLSKQTGVPFIDILGQRIDPEATALLSGGLAKRHNILPIAFEENKLMIATNDPLAFYVLDGIQTATGKELMVILAGSEDISYCIQKAYGSEVISQASSQANKIFRETDDFEPDEASVSRVEKTPIVQMINILIEQAYCEEASDIHIEPSKRELTIRYRINGDLIVHTVLNMSTYSAAVTRLKIMGGMNIAEKRLPQDGKFRFERNGITVDLRISTLPTVFGENLVIRLLGNGKQNQLLDVKKLGMSGTQMEQFRRMLNTSSGLILVAGPTGSGKTTTLYAALNRLVKKKINIITVEDPVEKIMEGVCQVQVNEKSGLTFANALRSLLRQDPDVIMVGEMRDSETASIGVRAAITGHQVLATIHTNDCASGVVRLMDMGVPPYMIAASLVGIIAQRLVKRLCPYCRQRYLAGAAEHEILGRKDIEYLWHPAGCERCNDTGYSGRTAIYEMFPVTGELGRMIARQADVHELRAYEEKMGNLFLREQVVKLAVEGETGLEEVEKIIYSIG